MCRRWLHDPDRPSIAGERPHVTVVVDLETLETASAADSARPKRSSNGMTQASGNSTSEGIRLPGAPFEGWRATRQFPAWLCLVGPNRSTWAGRQGLSHRHSGAPSRFATVVAPFPTCDRPMGWCEAHHVRHWADGGSTELSNLVLLCRRHHTVTHDGFRIEVLDGHPVFRRPDGTLIAARAGPRAGTRRSAPDVAVGTG
jgi:HNH endonuclease